MEPMGQKAFAKRPSGPGKADRLRRTGMALVRQGRLQDAIGHFEAALAHSPDDCETLFQLANTARRMGLHEPAIGFYRNVLARDPGRRKAIVNLSNTCREAGRPDEAVSLLKQAIHGAPDHPDLWLSLANAMRDLEDRATARTFFEEALRLDPEYGAALASLADLDLEEGRLDHALEGYDRAVHLAPKAPQMRLNRALALLQAGRLAEGWRDYSWRHKAAERPVQRLHRLKHWRGQPLKGRPLLVMGEQGVGDQLMFAALLPALLERTSTDHIGVAMDCEPRLAPLLSRSFSQMRIEGWHLEDRPDAWHISYDWLGGAQAAHWAVMLGDLPGLFWPETPSLRPRQAYLSTDPRQRAHWGAWLASLTPDHRPRIGLCWRSGKRTGLRAGHYAPLSCWTELARTLPGPIVAVQYDLDTDEHSAFETGAGVPLHRPPHLDQKADIDGATALLSQLDLVITAPTAVAYQAAGAGTPVLRLQPVAPWTCLGLEQDAFAPLINDVIAPSPGHWDSVFDEVRQRVQSMAPDPPTSSVHSI